MSYILEALKKAQAERQIGQAPTIHAATLAAAPAGQGRRALRGPALLAMGLMAAAIVGLAAMLVRQPSQQSQAAPAPANSPQPQAAAPLTQPGAPAQDAAVAVAPGASAALVAPSVAAAAPLAPASPLATAAPARPAAAAAAPARPVAAAAAPASPVAAAAAPASPVAAASTAPAPRPAEPPAQPRPAAPPLAEAPAEEQYQTLRELPEPIQRAIPQLALGGYMYSKNPADRLLLIDKVLRKEGDEVAPGLVLDKLLPKHAVFSFRGYRYRVPL